MYVDSPGLTAASTIQLDFGSSVASSTVSGSFPKPADESLADDRCGYVSVATYDGGIGAFVGACTLCQLSQDNTRIDFDAEWIEPPGHNFVTRYRWRQATQMNSMILEDSVILVDGVPVGGSQDLDFHSPPDGPASTPWEASVTWTPAAGESYDFQFLRLTADDKPQGELRVGALLTEATIPPCQPAVTHRRSFKAPSESRSAIAPSRDTVVNATRSPTTLSSFSRDEHQRPTRVLPSLVQHECASNRQRSIRGAAHRSR